MDLASADDAFRGVLRVQHLGLAFADPEPLLAQARARAVAAAHRQAEQLAGAAGVRLGRLRCLAEGAPFDLGEPTEYGGPRRMAAAAMPIQPGTQDLAVQVAVTYEIAEQEPPASGIEAQGRRA